MPRVCETLPIQDNDGNVIGYARVQRMLRPRPCSSCKASTVHGVLCDAPVTRDGKKGTCDRFCCRACAQHVGRDRDLCPAHARAAGKSK